MAGASTPILPALLNALTPLSGQIAGTRIHGHAAIRRLLSSGPIADIATEAIGPLARPVRATLFDKSATANWSLGWHQDRAVAVRLRAEVSGYGPWTVKQGILHVAPPFALIEGMVTLRIHLDAVPAGNAPLLVALGSHRLGPVRDADAAEVAEKCPILACLADAGDIWAYATPILHASDRAFEPRRRRVLQVDYAAEALPDGLSSLGV